MTADTTSSLQWSHKTTTEKVYILGPDAKKATPIKGDKVKLSVKKPAFQVEPKPEKQASDPEGMASAFVGKDDRFGVEQKFEGTVSAEVGGKQYAGDFKEKDDHDHPAQEEVNPAALSQREDSRRDTCSRRRPLREARPTDDVHPTRITGAEPSAEASVKGPRPSPY